MKISKSNPGITLNRPELLWVVDIIYLLIEYKNVLFTSCNICLTTLQMGTDVYSVQYTDPISSNAFTNCIYCHNCYIQSK